MAKTTYYSTFIDASIKAFQTWIITEWMKYSTRKLHTAVIGNITDLRKSNDVIKTQQLPTFLMSMARMELNSDRAGAAAKFREIVTSVDRARGIAVTRRLAPVRFGLMTSFRTDTGREVDQFAQMLMNSYPGTTFYFEDNTGLRVAARVYLDNGVDYPQADISGPGDIYEIQTVISMTTYIGPKTEQGLIRDIKVRYVEGTGPIVTTLSVDVATGDIKPLESTIESYTDPFDKSKPVFRGN